MYYSYPVAVDDGDIMLIKDDATAIKQAFYHVLNTVREERIMRPEYGMPDILFQGVSLSSVRSLVAEVVQIGLESYGVVYSLDFELRDGSLDVIITYDENRVVGTLEV